VRVSSPTGSVSLEGNAFARGQTTGASGVRVSSPTGSVSLEGNAFAKHGGRMSKEDNAALAAVQRQASNLTGAAMKISQYEGGGSQVAATTSAYANTQQSHVPGASVKPGSPKINVVMRSNPALPAAALSGSARRITAVSPGLSPTAVSSPGRTVSYPTSPQRMPPSTAPTGTVPVMPRGRN